MSIIKITGSGAYEHTQETNHSLEYLKRALTEHKIKPTLDHPDGSVTEEKLSAEFRDRMNKHESDIQEISNSKADKATVYTKSETDTILSTKADKATTYTIAQTNTILSTKADKAYTYTKAEVDSIADDVKEKVDDYLIPETSSLSAQLIYVGENKADRSELPTKVSQLENDKNYVTQEETESFVHSDTLASDYYNANYIDNIVNEVSDTLSTNETAILALREDIDNKFEKWEKVVDIEITEPISTSFRQEFGKQFKKIRFKIAVKGAGTANIRFKRDTNDGGASNYSSCNFLKIMSVNLSTTRCIVGTAYFDLDNYICIKDGIYCTQESILSTGSATAKSDMKYAEENHFFDEIFFHFGADCTVSSGKIEVWGCEV